MGIAQLSPPVWSYTCDDCGAEAEGVSPPVGWYEINVIPMAGGQSAHAVLCAVCSENLPLTLGKPNA